MQRLIKRTTPIILSGLLALFGTAACGDDDGGDNADDADDADDDDDDDDDGGDAPDAGEPDAAPPVLARTATIAITETNITNAEVLAQPVSGAVVSASFFDAATQTVAPEEGFTNNIGACRIVVFDVAGGEDPGTLTDEGPISVTGTANGDFNCGFTTVPEPQYLCQSTNAATASGTVANLDGNVGASLVTAGAVLNEAAAVGSTLIPTGFGNKAVDGQSFGVVQLAADNTFAIATPAGLPDFTPAPKGAAFATYIGAGPIPNAGGAYNFLGDAASITIARAETEFVPSFSVTYTSSGEGFVLDDDPKNGIYHPHEIPTDAAVEVTFRCTGAGCGTAGSGTGAIPAMVINGETTDGPLPAPEVDPLGTAMPDPVGSFATFTCGFPGASEAVIAMDAMAVILGTNPTRIQTTVLQSVNALNATPGGTATTTVVVGHSHTGFTTTAPGIASIARAKAARAKK